MFRGMEDRIKMAVKKSCGVYNSCFKQVFGGVNKLRATPRYRAPFPSIPT